MADAPPWPNFSLLQYYFILLCPIIIAHLLALLPSYVHDLARCSCIHQHVSMLQHLQIRKHYPPPRKKKVRPRSKREDATPPRPRLTVFAVGWFLYIISCRVETFCHRAAFMMTGHSRALRRYQACAAHVDARPGATTVRFDSDSYPIGVDGLTVLLHGKPSRPVRRSPVNHGRQICLWHRLRCGYQGNGHFQIQHRG